jgi:hypothetical protein
LYQYIQLLEIFNFRIQFHQPQSPIAKADLLLCSNFQSRGVMNHLSIRLNQRAKCRSNLTRFFWTHYHRRLAAGVEDSSRGRIMQQQSARAQRKLTKFQFLDWTLHPPAGAMPDV